MLRALRPVDRRAREDQRHRHQRGRDAEGVIAVYTGEDLAAAGLAPAKPPTPNMNQAMLAPLLAIDVVRFVGEPVAVIVTEEMYQGEDAIELVDVDYDPLPAVVDMNDALSGEKGLLFPDAGTNVVCTFGDPAGSSPDLFAGCEVVVSKVIQNTPGRRRPDGVALRRRRVGRGRAAHRLDSQPGRAGHQGRDRGPARPRAGERPDHHPRRRGRVRRQVRRRRRARDHLLDRRASWAGRPAGRRPAWRTCWSCRTAGPSSRRSRSAA